MDMSADWDDSWPQAEAWLMPLIGTGWMPSGDDTQGEK